MSEQDRVDLGSIQIHKKVIADIVFTALSDINGVKLIDGNFASSVLELFGNSKHPGINVHVDKNGQVSIEVKIKVRYGLSIPEIAHHAQDIIKEAIEKTVDINLKEVNVNVQGIERGK
jgi:uncharacterized alkaline shock family protein YloU